MSQPQKTFADKHQELWKFIKFSFTGASTTILDYAVFALLQFVVFRSLNETPVTDNAVLAFLGIQYKGYMYSYFVSSVISYTASYIMNRKLTFHADSNALLSSILYIIMVVVTVALTTWVFALLCTWLKNNGRDSAMMIMLTKLVVMLVSFLWTYPLQRFVIHRKKKEQADA